MQYQMVEKKDSSAVHGIFESKESGERFLKETVPEYVKKGYYMDKTLTTNDFEIVERVTKWHTETK